MLFRYQEIEPAALARCKAICEWDYRAQDNWTGLPGVQMPIMGPVLGQWVVTTSPEAIESGIEFLRLDCLSTIGQLSLLNQRFPDGIIVPQAVWREVVETGRDRPGAQEVASVS